MRHALRKVLEAWVGLEQQYDPRQFFPPGSGAKLSCSHRSTAASRNRAHARPRFALARHLVRSARDVQRQEDHRPDRPARVLGITGVSGIVDLPLKCITCLPRLDRPSEEFLAQHTQALDWIVPAARRPLTIDPVIVAGTRMNGRGDAAKRLRRAAYSASSQRLDPLLMSPAWTTNSIGSRARNRAVP